MGSWFGWLSGETLTGGIFVRHHVHLLRNFVNRLALSSSLLNDCLN